MPDLATQAGRDPSLFPPAPVFRMTLIGKAQLPQTTTTTTSITTNAATATTGGGKEENRRGTGGEQENG